MAMPIISRPFWILPVSGRVCIVSLETVASVVGVRLGTLAKIISVGEGLLVGVPSTEVTATEVGEGDGPTVGEGDKGKVCSSVGVGRATAIVGVTLFAIVGGDVSVFNGRLFFLARIKTKTITTVVNKKMVKKINLE